jgi:primary-amine oxidase
MRTRISLLALLLVAVAPAALPSAAIAACTSGTEMIQTFPVAGPAVSQWRFCYEILRMPDETGAETQSETLVIREAEFRPGASATPIRVLGDVRMAEIFVPYHFGSPRFHDLTEYAFDLQALTTTECPATRLDGNRICKEIGDRGLTWRDPYFALARRGEKLVLWSLLNAANYDYVMRYEFFDDGTMEVHSASTGRKYGGPDDTAGHMHNFAWRVDLDIAGAGGDTATLKGVRIGPSVKDADKTITREGGFKWDAKAFTHLEVTDGTAVNGRGRPIGYTLAPTREGVAKFPEAWTKYPMWVTRNHPGELRARDVATYAGNHEPVAGQDIVVWFTDSHNHENDMRDEDREVVPLSYLGFRLEPQNVWDTTPFYP